MEDLRLGQKIQNLRTDRGLSVRKLSTLAGITPSMLSQIENEQVNPSIQTLRSLAAALEVPLYDFFREEMPCSAVVTPETRMTIGRKTEPDVTYELLTPDTRGNIEFCMIVLPPHTSSNAQAQGHAGEEVAFFHSGTLVELEIEGIRHPLRVGDSIRIPAQARHTWHNPSDETAHVIFALSPPSF